MSNNEIEILKIKLLEQTKRVDDLEQTIKMLVDKINSIDYSIINDKPLTQAVGVRKGKITILGDTNER